MVRIQQILNIFGKQKILGFPYGMDLACERIIKDDNKFGVDYVVVWHCHYLRRGKLQVPGKRSITF